MAESFARLLKRHRISAGLSQEALAELAGVSSDEISSLERGSRRAPRSATLDLLAAALKLDDNARIELEEAARLARPRGPKAGRHDLRSDLREASLNNLPPQLTSFVNRDKELPEIKELLHSYRLVTLVGTGGAGKTRCAIKIAAELLESFGDGVWLVELARITDPTLVANAVARTLTVEEAAGRPMLDSLLAYLKRKRLLLIFDNCEHVIGEASHVAAAMLRDCPGVRILATSRESLSIAGERVYRVPSLSVPASTDLWSAAHVTHFGAVRLFADRATSADNRFTVTVESAPHVADICRRLDGIPLAIELAAARVKVLSPKRLAQKLNERFDVLTGGDRNALPRHQTMRALIDWSYDLLSDDERAMFRKLSIFTGGFTLESAIAVCTVPGSDEVTVVDLLASLVDKSLVQAEVVHGDMRYRLLESTRQYARERLVDAGEEHAIAYLHSRAFLMLAERLHDAWETATDRVWFAEVEPEMDNFRTALSFAFGPHGDVVIGQSLVGALRQAWSYLATAEGRRWLQIAQQDLTKNTPAAVEAALDLTEADLAWFLAQYGTSLSAAERALVHYRDLADPYSVAIAEVRVGRARQLLGQIAEGEALFASALPVLRELHAQRAVILTLQCLAFARNSAGDVLAARKAYNEALAASRALGAERGTATALLSFAESEFFHGDSDAALEHAAEALSIFRPLGNRHLITIAALNVASYLVALGRFDEARTTAREALTAARDSQETVLLAFTLQCLAAVAALRSTVDDGLIEDCERAARIFGYADARVRALAAFRAHTQQELYDAIWRALQEALCADHLAQLMSEGAGWTEDQANAEAMLI